MFGRTCFKAYVGIVLLGQRSLRRDGGRLGAVSRMAFSLAKWNTARSYRAFAGEDGAHGAQEDPKVQAQGTVLHIVDIVRDVLVHRLGATVHLPPACQAWLDIKAAQPPTVVLLEKSRSRSPARRTASCETYGCETPSGLDPLDPGQRSPDRASQA